MLMYVFHLHNYILSTQKNLDLISDLRAVWISTKVFYSGMEF